MFNKTEAKIKKLIKTLDEIIELLEWDDEIRWRKVVIEVKQDLEASKLSVGIHTLLTIYGGMGSFNDLVLGQIVENGKFIGWKNETKKKNKEFNALRSKAYDLGTELKEKS